MGEIRVRFYGALNLISGIKADKSVLKQGRIYSLVEPTSIRNLLEAHQIPTEHIHIVFIGKKRSTLDDTVHAGDTVHLFPAMAGG